MAILVTGGTGFIGTKLCEKLRERDEIFILTRRPKPQNVSGKFAVQMVESLDNISSNTHIHTAFNLAGESLFSRPWTKNRKQKLWDSRITTTQSLTALNARLDQPIEQIFSGSAVGYYGDKGDQPVFESAQPGQHFGAQLCKEWEKMAMENEQHGTRVTLLRTSIVLGHGGALAPMKPAFMFGLGSAIGSGNQIWPWIHIDDMVAALVFMMDQKLFEGPVNLCSPNPVSNREFSRTLAKVLNRPFWLPAIPGALIKKATLGAGELLTDSCNQQPGRLNTEKFEFSYPELELALRQLY